MFLIQVGAKTSKKYGLQGLFATERIDQFLNKNERLVRRRVLSVDTNTLRRETAKTTKNMDIIYIRLIYFLLF